MSLELFFNPRSIAIFGASRNAEKPGRVILRNLLQGGYGGEVYPLNPKATEIEGLKVYTVQDLPDVDLGIFAIRAELVPGALREAAEKLKAALIISGGFGEVGRNDLEKELLEIGEEYGIRIWGPNCLGIMNSHANLDATFIPLERMEMPKKGKVSILSQSGATLASIVDWANMKGMGVSKLASYGNQIDVSDYEILEYFAKDPETDVIGVYVEGLKDGRRFFEIARKIRKPVVYLKAGKGEKGRRAARSHTGALAGDYRVYRGVLKQAGMGEARNLEEFMNALSVLERWRIRGKRVGVVTCGGGFGVMTVDAAEENGLELVELELKNLRKEFPERVVLGNPVDLTGDATPEMFERVIEEIKLQVDAIFVILLFQLPRLNERIAEVLHQHAELPILIVSPPGEKANRFNSILKLPVFESPEKAVGAFRTAYEACSRLE